MANDEMSMRMGVDVNSTIAIRIDEIIAFVIIDIEAGLLTAVAYRV